MFECLATVSLILLLLYNRTSASFSKLFALSLRVNITNPFALRLVSTRCFKDLSPIRQGLQTVRRSFVLLTRKNSGAENRIILRWVSSVRVFLSPFRMKVQS